MVLLICIECSVRNQLNQPIPKVDDPKSQEIPILPQQCGPQRGRWDATELGQRTARKPEATMTALGVTIPISGATSPCNEGSRLAVF